jgi:hypothetical protein
MSNLHFLSSRFPTASIAVRLIYASLCHLRAIPLPKARVRFPGLASLELAVDGRLTFSDALGDFARPRALGVHIFNNPPLLELQTLVFHCLASVSA